MVATHHGDHRPSQCRATYVFSSQRLDLARKREGGEDEGADTDLLSLCHGQVRRGLTSPIRAGCGGRRRGLGQWQHLSPISATLAQTVPGETATAPGRATSLLATSPVTPEGFPSYVLRSLRVGREVLRDGRGGGRGVRGHRERVDTGRGKLPHRGKSEVGLVGERGPMRWPRRLSATLLRARLAGLTRGGAPEGTRQRERNCRARRAKGRTGG